MDIAALANQRPVSSVRSLGDAQNEAARQLSDAKEGDQPDLRKAFDSFVGETFYGQMLESLRKTVKEPAYFHGGKAEEVFRDQLDQLLSEKLAESSASSFTGPMFDLFQLNRS